jgi:hypothetical protein
MSNKLFEMLLAKFKKANNIRKQKLAEEEYERQLAEIKAGRIDVGNPDAQDIIARIQAIRDTVTSNIVIPKRELQNVKNPTNGETERMNVPVSSFPINLFEYSQLRQPQMLLLDRMLELIYML